MLLFLVLVVVPVVFCMVSWVLFTASRLFAVDDVDSAEQNAYKLRKRTRIAGTPMPIGSNADGGQSRYLFVPRVNTYRLKDEGSTGIPNLWHDDIWIRRN